MIAVITPTKNRAMIIRLLARWLRQQTVKPDLWIVVDDGTEDIEFEPPMTHVVKRVPNGKEPEHSLCLNLRAALPYMTAEKILICEDDEYYAPTYIEEMSARLDRSPAVGLGYSKYYHLGLKSFYVHENMQHASLAQTSFRREMIGTFIKALEDPKEKFIDIKFWKMARASGMIWRDADHYFAINEPGAQYVGMKGLPGNPGIGFGHKAMPQYKPDNSLDRLRAWIRPDDFKLYCEIGEKYLWTNSAN